MQSIKQTSSRHLIAATISLLCVGVATGAEPAHKAILSGYRDSAAGERLMAADYRAVIEELAPHRFAYWKDAVAASTNLCVAYTMTRAWVSAQSACDEAVRLARLEELGSDLYERQARDQQVALAYSNRAVLDWLQSKRDSAAADMQRAYSLSPQSEFVSQNLALLAGVNTAQVSPRVGNDRS
jgi:hypothetical protein